MINIFFDKIKLISQFNEKDCGPATLKMLLSYYNCDKSIYDIKISLNATEEGTSIRSLVKTAEKYGFEASPIKTNSISSMKKLNKPFIANIYRDGEPHFTLVKYISKTHIYIYDSLDGKLKMSHSKFYKIFSGYILFVSPPTIPKRNNLKKVDKFNPINSNLFKNNIPKISLVVFGSIIVNIANLINIYFFKNIIEIILPFRDIETLNIFISLLIPLFLLTSLIEYARIKLIALLSQSLESDLIKPFINHLVYLKSNYFYHLKSGEIISRINDIYKIREAISTILITFFVDFLILCSGIIFLCFLNFKLFLVSLLFLPVHIFCFIFFGKKYKILNRKEMESNAHLDNFTVHGFDKLIDIKSNTNEDKFFNNYSEKFDKLLKIRLDLAKSQGKEMCFRNFSDSLISIIILWIGLSQVLSNQMQLSNLIVFFAAITYFLAPINNIIGLHPLLNSAIVAFDRIRDLYSIEREYINNGEYSIDTICSLKISNLEFSIGNKNIFRDVNFSLISGDFLYLSGKSGSGKTSLLKTIINITQPSNGCIYINDINYENIKLKSIRSQISYVDDNPFFFKGSVYENLTFGIENKPSKDTAFKICQNLKLDNLLNTKLNGIDSMLYDNAENLSSGQKQRFNIAKALLKNPSLLILDEATSHLDLETESYILDFLKKMSEEKDIIIIFTSHGENISKYCNKKMHMNSR